MANNELSSFMHCPECDSTNIRQTGENEGKPKYICGNCDLLFINAKDFNVRMPTSMLDKPVICTLVGGFLVLATLFAKEQGRI